jgi:toxin-antitoxin system PIN domain toxin
LIALDSNLLVYAHRAESPFHAAASQRIRELAEGSATWAIPWPCLHEFMSIVTHPRIYTPPTPLGLAVEQVEVWLESPSVALLSESSTHWSVLKRLVIAGQITGPRTHDARIAALCLQHGVRELWSADRDFGRFRELHVVNPLIGPA